MANSVTNVVDRFWRMEFCFSYYLECNICELTSDITIILGIPRLMSRSRWTFWFFVTLKPIWGPEVTLQHHFYVTNHICFWLFFTAMNTPQKQDFSHGECTLHFLWFSQLKQSCSVSYSRFRCPVISLLVNFIIICKVRRSNAIVRNFVHKRIRFINET